MARYIQLLWPRWRALHNLARRDAGKKPIRRIVLGSLGLLFMVGAFLGARWLFGMFLQAEFLAELLIRRITGMLLLFFTGLLLFSNLVTSFSALYTALDLPALVSAPVSIVRLYLARLTLTWLQASWMMLVFALPVLAAIGPILGAPWWYYPVLPAILLPLTVFCAALGSMGAMILARWFPVHRTREAFALLAVVAFVVVYVAFRLAEPERFFEPGRFGDLVTLISSLRADGVSTTPPGWTADLIFASVGARGEGILLTAVTLFLSAASVVVLGAWLARALYLPGLMLAQEGRGPTRRSKKIRRSKPSSPPTSPEQALMRRDNRLFFRTPAQWTQLLLVGALVVVYLLNFRYFKTLTDGGIIGSFGLFAVNYLLGGLVVTTLAARFLYPSVSLEGYAFWRIRAAPITVGRLLAAKARWGARPLVCVAVVMATASDLIVDLSLWMVCVSAGLAALTAWTLSAMAIGFGALDPRFDIDAPARIASGMGAVTFMLVGIAYLAIIGVLWIRPLEVLSGYFDLHYIARPARIAQAIGLALASVLVSYGARRWSLFAGGKSLDALDR